jgi:O-antigen ligase
MKIHFATQDCFAPCPDNVEASRRAGYLEWSRLLLLVWSGPQEPRARQIRIGLIDFFILILAAAICWSTTATTVLVLCILLMISMTHGPRKILQQIKHPACALPVALVAIAMLGALWADGVPWAERLHALRKTVKLLWLPLFFLHFQMTSRGPGVLAAYAISNLVLAGFSFLTFLSSEVRDALGAANKAPGVFLKNYIDQSQGFALTAVISVALAIESVRRSRFWRVAMFLVGSAVSFAELAFVNVARTAFIYIPAMLLLLLLRYTRGWALLAMLAGLSAIGAVLWVASPNLQVKAARVLHEVGAFESNATTVNGYPASGAERLEFWRKSIKFVQAAPFLGHGTGSTRALFAAEAAGESGLKAKVVDNPHNQTLAVSIQWGMLGCLAL